MATDETDRSRVASPWDAPVAFVLLTRLPLPALPPHAFTNGARAVWAYPLVGLVLGALASLVLGVATAIGLPPALAAGLALTTLVLLSGAMHEDGLADTADGLWGGHTPARRLEIMKDSRIGAYGVLALILAMGLRWLGLAEVTWSGLITAAVLSRAAMVVPMHALPHARDHGLAHSVGRASLGGTLAALGGAALCAAILSGAAGLAALIVALAVTTGIIALARHKIGGQTGDILGATQICAEIAALMTLTVAFP